jgi:hypothetical protein
MGVDPPTHVQKQQKYVRDYIDSACDGPTNQPNSISPPAGSLSMSGRPNYLGENGINPE